MTWSLVLVVVLVIYVLWQELDKRLLEKRVTTLRAGLVDLTNRNLNLVQDLIELRRFTDSRQRALDLEIEKNARMSREFRVLEDLVGNLKTTHDQLQVDYDQLNAQYETLRWSPN